MMLTIITKIMMEMEIIKSNNKIHLLIFKTMIIIILIKIFLLLIKKENINQWQHKQINQNIIKTDISHNKLIHLVLMT